MPLKCVRLGMCKKQGRSIWVKQRHEGKSTLWLWQGLDLVGLCTQNKKFEFYFLNII